MSGDEKKDLGSLSGDADEGLESLNGDEDGGLGLKSGDECDGLESSETRSSDQGRIFWMRRMEVTMRRMLSKEVVRKLHLRK